MPGHPTAPAILKPFMNTPCNVWNGFCPGCPWWSLPAILHLQKHCVLYSSMISPDWSIKRVLGVIRPTSGDNRKLQQGLPCRVMGTPGTVQSGSYLIEIEKFFPGIRVSQEACPMWVSPGWKQWIPFPGADYFVAAYRPPVWSWSVHRQHPAWPAPTIPLLMDKISKFAAGVSVIAQGPIIAASLQDYLLRHPEIDEKCSKKASGNSIPPGNWLISTTMQVYSLVSP